MKHYYLSRAVSMWILLAFVFYHIFTTYHLPKSDWECTAYDVRPKHGECVEYHVKEKNSD